MNFFKPTIRRILIPLICTIFYFYLFIPFIKITYTSSWTNYNKTTIAMTYLQYLYPQTFYYSIYECPVGDFCPLEDSNISNIVTIRTSQVKFLSSSFNPLSRSSLLQLVAIYMLTYLVSCSVIYSKNKLKTKIK